MTVRARQRLIVALVGLAAMGLVAPLPQATEAAPPAARPPSGAAGPVSPLRDIGFDQNLGGQVPLDLEFKDESGTIVRLGDFVHDKPVVLSLAYYDCPMLCGMALQGLAASLKTIAFSAGKEFRVLTVSFDPRETPALARAKKPGFLASYGRAGAEEGWRFLTGDEEPIRRLTSAVGFRYAWDEEQKQYAHATGIVVLTPEGRIARYLFGIEYPARDLRLGLIEAADGKIGNLADQLLLLCYHYDPRTGRYSAAALGSVRVAGGLTVLALGAFIVVMVRRERRRANPGGTGGS